MNQVEQDLLYAIKGFSWKYRLPVLTILEAGACDGTDTAHILSKFSDAHLYAFEPSPAGAAACRTNYANEPRVTFEEAALGELSGRRRFHPVFTEKAEIEGGGSVLPAIETSPGIPRFRQTTAEVACRRLDEWAAEHGVASIDLLWLDMEGSELAALRGLGKVLEDVSIVAHEFFIQPTLQGQPLFGDLWRFLDAAGFVLVSWVLFNINLAGNAIWLNRRKLV